MLVVQLKFHLSKTTTTATLQYTHAQKYVERKNKKKKTP